MSRKPSRWYWLIPLVINALVCVLGVVIALDYDDWRAWPWICLCACAAALSWWFWDRDRENGDT